MPCIVSMFTRQPSDDAVSWVAIGRQHQVWLMQMFRPPLEIIKRYSGLFICQSLESAWFSIPDSEPGTLEKYLGHISSMQRRQHKALVCSLLGFWRWCSTVSYKVGPRIETIWVPCTVPPLTRCGPWASHKHLSTSISSLLVGNIARYPIELLCRLSALIEVKCLKQCLS